MTLNNIKIIFPKPLMLFKIIKINNLLTCSMFSLFSIKYEQNMIVFKIILFTKLYQMKNDVKYYYKFVE